MPRNLTHIPPLSRDSLIVAAQRIDRLAIPDAAKRELKRMLSAASNPDNEKIETIIKTLPKPRQEEILRIFDEVYAMQQANEQTARNTLLGLGLLTLAGLIASYLLTTDQQAQQAAQLLNISKRVWVDAIQDEINYVGGNQRARAASGADLAYLEAMAREDAQSIVNTFNRDAQRQLEKLYKENPNASKQFFIESMKAWVEKRAGWKGLQIAANTEFKAREYARARFAAMNYAASTLYKFVGPPTTCEICLKEFAAGFVSYQHTLDAPCPRHVSCPHKWLPVRKPKVDLVNLWVG